MSEEELLNILYNQLPNYMRSNKIKDVILSQIEKEAQQYNDEFSDENFSEDTLMNLVQYSSNILETIKNDFVAKKLTTNNIHLDKLIKKYFVYNVIDPKIGNYSFSDVKNQVEFAIEEYSKTYSRVCDFGQKKSLEALMKLNDIDIDSYKILINNINELFKLHRDNNFTITEKLGFIRTQINEYTSSDPKLQESISSNQNYYHKLLKLLEVAEVNQLVNNRYIVIDNLFKTKASLNLDMANRYNFKEKKKYLKKSKSKLDILKKYIKDIGNQKIINYFLWYLAYGGNKTDVYMLHSILGYSYPKAKELYKHILQKQNKTAEQDFLLNLDLLNSKNIEDITLQNIINKL